jgi:TM2 domain-containing membrane protein YozV
MSDEVSGRMPPAPRKPKLEITLEDLAPARSQPRVAQPSGVPVRPEPPAALPSVATAVKPAVGERTFCRACGLPLDSRAMLCPGCGVATGNVVNAGVAAAALAMNAKSPGTAIVLSMLWAGAGQIYCGRAGRGIAFMAAGFVSALLILAVIGLVLLPIVWVWAMVDAYQLAKNQNQALLAAASVVP